MTDDRMLRETFEILGKLREDVTMLQSHCADLEDDQLSLAVDRLRTWTVTAGNRVALLRMAEAIAA